MPGTDDIRARAVVVVAIVVLIAGLKASYPVTMPLAAAAVTIAAIWPLKSWFDRVLPQKLAFVVTILVLLLLTAA